jgi:mycothiol synthase
MGPSLPDGYSARPPVRADLGALADLAAASDLHDIGEVDYTADDISGFWDLPGVHLERDCCVVAHGDRLVATVDLWPRAADDLEGGFQVHPDHRGGGLEEWLVAWSLDRARSAARDARRPAQVSLWSVAGGAGEEALDAAGFAVARHFSRMSIDLGEDPPAAPEPDGVDIVPFRPEEHGRALHTAHEEAFADHFRHHTFTYEEWADKRFSRSGFDPLLWIVAWDGDAVVAYVLAEPLDKGGWVSTVGVVPAWRGRGLAKALLLRVFAVLHARGVRRVSLGVDVDNETGATRLYERVGMRESARYRFHTRTVEAPR